MGTNGLNIACSEELQFTADEWKAYSDEKKQEILLNYRIAYRSETKVNWCQALGTVLANDEVINGLSERGGYPVEQRLMRQWSLRVSAYAQRLLDGLDKIDWSESIKETQRNWIGRSEGAEIHLPLAPSKRGGSATPPNYTTNKLDWNTNIDNARKNRKESTVAENALWQMLRNKNIGYKFRRQHLIDRFIVDFVCFEKSVIVEVDGKYHESDEQMQADQQRTDILKSLGYEVLRFSNEEVIGNIEEVLQKIKSYCDAQVPSFGGDLGEVAIFTTRADTIDHCINIL